MRPLTSFDAESIEKGRVYRDKRGREWKVLAWLYQERGDPFFRTYPDKRDASHLHAFDEKRKTGKFIKIGAFAKSIVAEVCSA